MRYECNISVINGGIKSNIVPDFAKIKFEVCYEHMSERKKVLQTVEELKDHAKLAGVGVEVAGGKGKAPMMTTEKTFAWTA